MSAVSGWKSKLLQVKELRKNALQNAYERVKLLTEVYEDEQFRHETPGDDDFLVAILTEHISDLCGVHGETNFRHFYLLFKEFPGQERWDSGDFKSMFAEYESRIEQRQKDAQRQQKEAINQLAGVSGGNGQPQPKAPTYWELRKERDHLQQRVREKDGIERTLHARIQALLQQIAELERENRELRGRLKREAVAA